MNTTKKNSLDSTDVEHIVRNLINFIVVDGKKYVKEDEMSNYVSSYIHVLIKTINLIKEKEISSPVEDIAQDISKYLK